MLLVSAVLILALAVGFLGTHWLPVKMEGPDRLLWALPLGTEALTLVTFLGSAVLGNVALAGTVAFFLALVFIIATLTVLRHRNKSPWAGGWTWGNLLPILAVLVPWVLFSAVVYPNMVVWSGGNLVSGWINAWGDWAAHLRTSTFLASQNPFSLENSLLSGVPARYPLLEDFLTSLYQRAGIDPVSSLVWSGLPFFALFPALVHWALRRLGLRPWFAVLGTALFVFSGGLGVFKLLFDLVSGVPWTLDPYHPRLYTDIREASGAQTNSSIWFMNFVTCEFIPQRAFLFGLPWALMTLVVFWGNFLLKPTRRHRYLAAGGLGAAWACLLLFHTHSAVALGVTVAVGALLVLGRELLARTRPRVGPGLVLGAVAVGTGAGLFSLFLMDPSKVGTFLHVVTGWMPGPSDLPTALLFLVRNLGIVLLGGTAALAVREHRVRTLAVLALVLLVLGNFVAFQPWIWDNEKLLTWWYFLAAAALVFWVQHRWKRRPPRSLGRSWALTVSILVILGTGAGAWDVAVLGGDALKPGLGLADLNGSLFGQGVGQYLKDHPEDSRRIIAIAPEHNHPVSLFSGGRLYLGFTGWVWSYGLGYQDRADRLPQVFAGGPAGLAAARAAGIGFVVCGPPEKNQYKADLPALSQVFTPVLTFGDWTLLKVP